MTPLSMRNLINITLSILLALIASILPLPQWLMLIWPQWVALIIIYWVLTLPHRVNLTIAWLVGLLLDGLYGSLLGEHALALCVIAYITYRLHRQIRMFPVLQQAVFVFFLVLAYQAILIWIQGMLGMFANIHLFWISAITSMMVWPWLFLLLRTHRQPFGIE